MYRVVCTVYIFNCVWQKKVIFIDIKTVCFFQIIHEKLDWYFILIQEPQFESFETQAEIYPHEEDYYQDQYSSDIQDYGGARETYENDVNYNNYSDYHYDDNSDLYDNMSENPTFDDLNNFIDTLASQVNELQVKSFLIDCLLSLTF